MRLTKQQRDGLDTWLVAVQHRLYLYGAAYGEAAGCAESALGLSGISATTVAREILYLRSSGRIKKYRGKRAGVDSGPRALSSFEWSRLLGCVRREQEDILKCRGIEEVVILLAERLPIAAPILNIETVSEALKFVGFSVPPEIIIGEKVSHAASG